MIQFNVTCCNCDQTSPSIFILVIECELEFQMRLNTQIYLKLYLTERE